MIRGGTHTIYITTCADEGGTQGALFMCYFIVNCNGNQGLQASKQNVEWAKVCNTVHDDIRTINHLGNA